MTEFKGLSGKIKFLRVNDSSVDQVYGAPGDELHTQVVVVLDSSPDMAFGFEIKGDDPNLPSRLAMLSVLRDAYIHELNIGIGYFIEEGKKVGILIRIDLQR